MYIDYPREVLEKKLAEERESYGQYLKEHYQFGFQAFVDACEGSLWSFATDLMIACARYYRQVGKSDSREGGERQ